MRKAVRFISDHAGMSFLIICAIVSAVIVLVFVLGHPFLVVGESMIPTYHDGQIVFTKTDIEPSDIGYGTVVVLKAEDKELIKRIVALPGDTVEIENGILKVNGVPEERGFDRMNASDMTRTLGEDEYFYLGDNRNGSSDSRNYGPAAFEDIEAVVS